jgi:hypothetical protein
MYSQMSCAIAVLISQTCALSSNLEPAFSTGISHQILKNRPGMICSHTQALYFAHALDLVEPLF